MPDVAAVRAQIEETRGELGVKVNRLVRRTKYELDWRSRLRRNLPKLVIGAVAAGVVVGGVLLVKLKFTSSPEDRARAALTDPVDLEELAVQVRALREELDTRMRGDEPLVQRLVLRATAAAGAAAGTLAARHLMERFAPDVAVDVEQDPKELARTVASVT